MLRSTRTGLLADLRAGTRDLHHEVEDRLGLPHGVSDRTVLTRVLSHLLRTWAPLEQWLLATPGWSSLGLDPRLGFASDLLQGDLRALGAPDPQTRRLPSFERSLSGGVGVRYVLLGSALGGRAVAPELEARLELPESHGTAFFRRTGRAPAADWATFRRAIADHEPALDGATALAGARFTFETLL